MCSCTLRYLKGCCLLKAFELKYIKSTLGRVYVPVYIKLGDLLLILSFSVLLFKDGLLLKLCDFGTAKKLEHTLTNAVGTIRYMAPEVIRGIYS